MYDSRSKKAEEFIDDSEIKRTLEYAEKHRGDIELLEAILEKGALFKEIGRAHV